MKLFITGAGGQLGTELQRMLRTGYAEIGAIPAEYADAEIMAVDREELDITDFAALQNALETFAPDIIINCAAMTNVDGCETNQDLAFLLNSAAPQQLALYASKHDCKLVQVSTDYVFAGNGVIPYKEWDVCLPQSIYGKSKHFFQRILGYTCHTFFTFIIYAFGFITDQRNHTS